MLLASQLERQVVDGIDRWSNRQIDRQIDNKMDEWIDRQIQSIELIRKFDRNRGNKDYRHDKKSYVQLLIEMAIEAGLVTCDERTL